jgi:hypothetical protein
MPQTPFRSSKRTFSKSLNCSIHLWLVSVRTVIFIFPPPQL